MKFYTVNQKEEQQRRVQDFLRRTATTTQQTQSDVMSRVIKNNKRDYGYNAVYGKYLGY